MEIAIIPRFILNKFFHDEMGRIHMNVLISSMLIIVLFVILNNDHFHLASMPHLCVFQKLLNIPCPGCGVTRSILAMARGDTFSAFIFNPVGILLFLFFIAQIPLCFIALKCITTRKCISQLSRVGSNTTIIALILVWMFRLTQ
jgi:hypothetical protein